MKRSWDLYKRRFLPLTMLNCVSYLPHAMHIAFLLAACVALSIISDALRSIGGTSEYSGLFFVWLLYVVPKWIVALLAAAAVICLILWFLVQVFGLALYLLLELAYVYVLADDQIGPWDAVKKARKRLRGFFWVELCRSFIVSNAGMLLIPGAVFWVWYQFTPFVFALQREEGTPLSSLWESRELVRGLWGKVFGQLISMQFLPLTIVFTLPWLIFAGLPFYWIFGTFLFSFTGHYPYGMFGIYGPHFWEMLCFCFLAVFLGFYLPFQKVVLYTLYCKLKEVKTFQGTQST
ncbi:MAG TPA: hypothetical protein VMT71_12245 [Syntrophorhabdales bacterium]|nr:hypothetical protein [Syntrophorhabdales bacterium]